jgi:hypothetical protein
VASPVLAVVTTSVQNAGLLNALAASIFHLAADAGSSPAPHRELSENFACPKTVK